MKNDYMGYGDIYGGIFDKINFLTYDLFFEGDVKSMLRNLNIIPAKREEKKINLEKVEEEKYEICFNC